MRQRDADAQTEQKQAQQHKWQHQQRRGKLYAGEDHDDQNGGQREDHRDKAGSDPGDRKDQFGDVDFADQSAVVEKEDIAMLVDSKKKFQKVCPMMT